MLRAAPPVAALVVGVLALAQNPPASWEFWLGAVIVLVIGASALLALAAVRSGQQRQAADERFTEPGPARVVLAAAGEKPPVSLIRAVRTTTGRSLADAVDLARAGGPLADGISAAAARAVADEILAAGGRATVSGQFGEITAAATGEPADWLFDAAVKWSSLTRYGPPDLPTYVRIEFEPAGVPDSYDAVGSTLEVLAEHTTTPEVGYAAVWEGWGAELAGPAAQAPRVEVPERPMLLLTGPVLALRDAPSLGFHATVGGFPPHLAWPADQAWCLACEVDEEIAFTVGCTQETARALAAALPGVREVEYDAPEPLHRDDA